MGRVSQQGMVMVACNSKHSEKKIKAGYGFKANLGHMSQKTTPQIKSNWVWWEAFATLALKRQSLMFFMSGLFHIDAHCLILNDDRSSVS